MVDLFKMAPDRVHWELTTASDGSCHLTIHHAGGTLLESFTTPDRALRRVHTLEELLLRAVEHVEARASR